MTELKRGQSRGSGTTENVENQAVFPTRHHQHAPNEFERKCGGMTTAVNRWLHLPNRAAVAPQRVSIIPIKKIALTSHREPLLITRLFIFSLWRNSDRV